MGKLLGNLRCGNVGVRKNRFLNLEWYIHKGADDLGIWQKILRVSVLLWTLVCLDIKLKSKPKRSSISPKTKFHIRFVYVRVESNAK